MESTDSMAVRVGFEPHAIFPHQQVPCFQCGQKRHNPQKQVFVARLWHTEAT